MGQRGIYVPINKTVLEDLYWNQGLSIPQVAEEVGVALRTVHRRMIEYGIPRRNMGPRPRHGEEVKRASEVLTPKFLRERYVRKGMTTGQIGAETGFNPTAVTYYVRQAGTPIRPVGFIRQYDIKKKELAKLRRQGRSPRQIADYYGCSVTTVERTLRRYGLVGRN
jgi:transposase